MSAVSVPRPGNDTGPRRQKDRSDLSTRRLLEASAALISERGYERMTLAEIGTRAGYSEGLVTRRFGSKANLLVALVDRLTARYGPEHLLETLGPRTGTAAVVHVFEQIAADLARSPDDLRGFYGLMFEGLKPIPELHERLRDLNRTFRAQLADVIAAGVRDGTVRNGTDPTAAATFVACTLRGLAFFWMLDPDRFDLEAELRSTSTQISAMLTP